MDWLIEDAVVFVAGDNYNIIWNTTEKGLAWVEIDGEKFYDADNGNIKSEERVHKVVVPQKVLDAAGEYTIVYKTTVARHFVLPRGLPTAKNLSYLRAAITTHAAKWRPIYINT